MSGYDTYAFVADLYDHVIPYLERRDVMFFVDAARESRGPVLEIGCGTGRVLIPTAHAGIDIVGLDYSSHMLDVCRARLRMEPDAVRERTELVEADMRQFDLGRPCLACIRRHLEPDGQYPGELIFVARVSIDVPPH